jgi:hypothetical protein
MNDYTSMLMAEQRHREFMQEAALDRLAKSVSGKQNQQRDEEFTASTTHSSGKSDGLRRLVPVTVGSIR